MFSIVIVMKSLLAHIKYNVVNDVFYSLPWEFQFLFPFLSFPFISLPFLSFPLFSLPFLFVLICFGCFMSSSVFFLAYFTSDDLGKKTSHPNTYLWCQAIQHTVTLIIALPFQLQYPARELVAELLFLSCKVQ